MHFLTTFFFIFTFQRRYYLNHILRVFLVHIWYRIVIINKIVCFVILDSLLYLIIGVSLYLMISHFTQFLRQALRTNILLVNHLYRLITNLLILKLILVQILIIYVPLIFESTNLIIIKFYWDIILVLRQWLLIHCTVLVWLQNIETHLIALTMLTNSIFWMTLVFQYWLHFLH